MARNELNSSFVPSRNQKRQVESIADDDDAAAVAVLAAARCCYKRRLMSRD